jgi:hypothetical protein
MRLGLGGILLLVASAATAQPAPSRWARINYLTTAQAFLDAGRDEGIAEGMSVHVVRAGRRIGLLEVSAIASHRAACTIIAADSTLAIGDSVEFTPATRSDVVARVDGPGASARSPLPPSRSLSRLRGRVGLRMLMLQPPAGRSVTQPALDFRLDGTSLGGSPVGLLADVRARQTYTTAADGARERATRTAVYQAGVLFRSPHTPARLTVGRQYLPTVSSVSLFDGALVEWQPERFGAGLFLGSEPEPVTMGYSSEVRSYGLFLEGRSRAGARARWSISGGAVGSYASGEINREFAFLQASLSTPGLTAFVAQEVDVNRGWKAEAGEATVVPTSTFATVAVRPSSWLSLQAGFDNRRNVRLYRDQADPESVFDDQFRQGIWGGVGLSLGAHGRLGGDVRATLAGADSTSRTSSWTAVGSLERLTVANLGLRARVTRYVALARQGWLQSAAIAGRPVPWLGLELNGGIRQEEANGAAPRRTTWLGGDLDVAIGRAWYVLLSGSRERGDGAAGDQVYAGLSFRF